MQLRRGFSSPGFDQGKQSEYDAALETSWEEYRGRRPRGDVDTRSAFNAGFAYANAKATGAKPL